MPSISVLSMKGGVGKTTVTLGLASAAWQRGRRTLVVDLDPQGNATMGLRVEDPPLTVTDVLADGRPGIAASAATPSGWGPLVQVLAADRGLEHRNIPEGPYSSQRLRSALSGLTADYDLILLDCPPSLGELTRNALSAAGQALIVAEPGYFSLRGAQQAIEAAEVIRSSVNPGLAPTHLVVNRARTMVAEHRARITELQAAFPGALSSVVIPERHAISQAEAAGMPIHAWDSPAGRELAALFDELLAELAGS